MRQLARRIIYFLIFASVVGAIAYGFKPQPVDVDVELVSVGPMEVTVDEDGKTRIREKYIVSAPLAGRLQRIELEPGDEAVAGETLLATIEPADPELLDARALAQIKARVSAAAVSLKRAEPQLEQARASLDFAETDLARKRELASSKALSQDELDAAEMRFKLRSEEYRSARLAVEIAQYELQQAEAAALRTDPESSTIGDESWNFRVRSPINGRVLRVLQESTAIVSAGTPLLELGDAQDLEIEIDVLSSDAVQISPGNRVRIQHWGGEHELEGKVQLVEPAAFTKISALGVEEQRVWIIVDIVDPPNARPTLGDGFRVEGRIVTWESSAVLRVPTSALFRDANRDWAVFVASGDHAKIVSVEIGHRNDQAAEVVSGLSENDTVIVHPSDRVEDGTLIQRRE
ncbi:MAG: HlyD family efflux transporter periplasmic adaptor subunit [Planctomycetales bacterium]|nr:HlyD family efflux transporter periplasmic adaptor subunit [Planctomycetales bacterium]